MPTRLPRVSEEWHTPRSRVLAGPYRGRVLSAALSCRSCSPRQHSAECSEGGEAPHVPNKRQTLCLTSSLHSLAVAEWNQKERKEVDQALSVHTGLPQRDLRGRELVALVIKAIDCPGTHCACRGQQSGLVWPCFLEEGCPQRFSSLRFN